MKKRKPDVLSSGVEFANFGGPFGGLFTRTSQFLRAATIKPTKKRIGRNQQCPCASGKKYKKCCGGKKK